MVCISVYLYILSIYLNGKKQGHRMQKLAPELRLHGTARHPFLQQKTDGVDGVRRYLHAYFLDISSSLHR